MKKKKHKPTKHERIQANISAMIPKEAVETYNHFLKEILPILRQEYTVSVIHATTRQTRIVNESNGKKMDYYPYYRKYCDFQYMNWSRAANDGEILTLIKTILR